MQSKPYNGCTAPNCRNWAPVCAAGYCNQCCTKIHFGVHWSAHQRPSGDLYIWKPTGGYEVKGSNYSYANPHNPLPATYGGPDNKRDPGDLAPAETAAPGAPPNQGEIEELTVESPIWLPVDGPSYGCTTAAGFPVVYVK